MDFHALDIAVKDQKMFLFYFDRQTDIREQLSKSTIYDFQAKNNNKSCFKINDKNLIKCLQKIETYVPTSK